MTEKTQERILKVLAFVVLALMFVGALVLGAHADPDTSKVVGKAMFKTGDVNLAESTVRLEPLISPVFVATWCVDDPCQPLKNVPRPKQIITCNVADYTHEGYHYTQLLNCVGDGDEAWGEIWLKSVVFERMY